MATKRKVLIIDGHPDARDDRYVHALSRAYQEGATGAGHIVVLYPLWLGSMPALLKAFLEQVLRPGFAFAASSGRGLPKKLLTGRSARVIVTMGMPGPLYRLFYRAHSLKSLERNILRLAGFAPVRSLVIGGIDALAPDDRRRTLDQVQELGRRAV